MPTYDYRCEGCKHRFEAMHSIMADPLKLCPACNHEKLVRLIGSGGGIVFKGPGFYATDYKTPTQEPKKEGP